MGKRYRGSGYQSYYGRRGGGGGFLKWLAVFLLAVLVVSIGVYVLLQEGLIYDGDGVHIALPWKREPVETSPPPSSPPPSLSPSAPPSQDASPSQSVLVVEPDPDPPPIFPLREEAAQTLRAVSVNQTDLLSGRTVNVVQEAGGNAALLVMKTPEGMLNYVSSNELAISMSASGSDGAVNMAVAALKEEDVYTIAQVSCFCDNLLGSQDRYALLTNSGYRWKDVNNLRWTCAANEAVQAYLAQVCVELVQMGFDEILLTDCGYPETGRGQLGWIRKGNAYPAGSLDTVTGPFLSRVREAVAPYGGKLSVAGLGAELMGESAKTGLTAANVVENCDHIWVTSEDAAAYARFASAPDTGLSALLVTTSTQAGGDEGAWAVISG